MRNVKILFIAGSDFTIHPNHRAHHFVRFLEEKGAKVDVISLRRFYSGAEQVGSWQRFREGVKSGEQVEVIERANGMQLLLRRLPGRFDFVAQDFWAAFQLGRLKNKQYEVCIYGNPDNAYLPVWLKRRGIVKTIVYDDWDYYEGFDHSRMIKNVIHYREKWCASHANLVVSVGYLLAKLRENQGADKTIVIPNGVNYPLFSQAQKKGDHPPTLVYIGKLAEEYGVDVAIRGFAEIVKTIPDARFMIIGYNQDDYAQYLRGIVEDLGLEDRVDFIAPQPYEDLPNYLAQADVGVALFTPTDLMKFAFPLKVVEYMAAGLPVVGSKVGETERIIEESGAGYAVPFDAEDFAEKALLLLGDDELLKNTSARAAEHARKYDWAFLFDQLIGSQEWQALEGE